MFGLGFGELILIFLIALIFIGPKKLPELAKGLGQGIKEFQKAAKGLTDQMNDHTTTPPEVKPIPPIVSDTHPIGSVAAQHTEPSVVEEKPSEDPTQNKV